MMIGWHQHENKKDRKSMNKIMGIFVLISRILVAQTFPV